MSDERDDWNEGKRCLQELRLAGLYDADSDYDGMVGKAVEELLDCFHKQGHSGHSAGLVASIFNRLVTGKTLTPLTGEDDEWFEPMDGVWQNKRCHAVFKDHRRAWYIRARVFVANDGISFTCSESSSDIQFPFMPTTVFINEDSIEGQKAYADVFRGHHE